MTSRIADRWQLPGRADRTAHGVELAENPGASKATEAPDLRHNCPVCAQPYRPGEALVGLARFALGPSGAPRTAAHAGSDRGGDLILGHYACVLPRLLTLLAGFQPEVRFEKASKDFAAIECVFPEPHHGQP